MANEKKRDAYKESFKFDKRLNERLVKQGDVSEEEFKKYIETLPDLGSQIEMIHLGGQHGNSSTH